MQEKSNRLTCPGCDNQLHKTAVECNYCGFRSETKTIEGILGSFSMISSILVGFTLAALVSLVAEGYPTTPDLALDISTGCWVVCSILYMLALVGSEILRRTELGVGFQDRMDNVWKWCDLLFWVISLAVFLTAVGVVILAFHFSPYHGGAALTVTAISLVFLSRMFKI